MMEFSISSTFCLFFCIFSGCCGKSQEEKLAKQVAKEIEAQFSDIRVMATGYKNNNYYLDCQSTQSMNQESALAFSQVVYSFWEHGLKISKEPLYFSFAFEELYERQMEQIEIISTDGFLDSVIYPPARCIR